MRASSRATWVSVLLHRDVGKCLCATLQIVAALICGAAVARPAAAQEPGLSRASLLEIERHMRAQAAALDAAHVDVSHLGEILYETSASLMATRQAFESARARHAAWMASFLGAATAYDPARDLPLDRTWGDLQPGLRRLHDSLPDTARDRAHAHQALRLLLDFVDRADQAVASVGRTVAATSARGAAAAAVTASLYEVEASLLRSLQDARRAYLLLNAQVDTRARLALVVRKVWDDRAGIAAARGAIELAQDMDSELPPAMQRVLLPYRWQSDFALLQGHIDAMADTPALALRKQRILGSHLDAHEASVVRRAALGECVDDLVEFIRSIRASHQQSLDRLTTMPAATKRERFWNRLTHMGSNTSSYGDASDICVHLAEAGTSDDPIASEEAYAQWCETCIAGR